MTCWQDDWLGCTAAAGAHRRGCRRLASWCVLLDSRLGTGSAGGLHWRMAADGERREACISCCRCMCTHFGRLIQPRHGAMQQAKRCAHSPIATTSARPAACPAAKMSCLRAVDEHRRAHSTVFARAPSPWLAAWPTHAQPTIGATPGGNSPKNLPYNLNVGCCATPRASQNLYSFCPSLTYHATA